MNNTFGQNIIPDNEDLRLQALEYYEILNALPNRYFTTQAYIVAETFKMPIALISLVGKELVFFKGNVGMPGVETVDRGESLCSLAILDPNPTVFHDALEEPCLMANPMVMGDFGLRFYAGAPITTKQGFHIGTVCVVDKQPRDFTENDKKILLGFADNVMREIESRKFLSKVKFPIGNVF